MTTYVPLQKFRHHHSHTHAKHHSKTSVAPKKLTAKTTHRYFWPAVAVLSIIVIVVIVILILQYAAGVNIWSGSNHNVSSFPTGIQQSSSSTAGASSTALSGPSSSSSPSSSSIVIGSNTVSLATGTIVWNVNTVGDFVVGDIVQITWTGDSGDYFQGVITAISASTITVHATSITGQSGIPWSPWLFTLLSGPQSSSSSSSPIISMFNVVLVTKVQGDPFYGIGFSSEYRVNGVNAPPLSLTRGITYTFNVSVPSVHPLYIGLNPNGGAGVNNSALLFITGGVASGTFLFTPNACTPSLVYYECENHPNVGNSITVTGASLHPCPSSSSSSSTSARSISSSSSSSSPAPALNFEGVLGSNNIPLETGTIVWNVNTVASFYAGNVVQITWTESGGYDYMEGTITAVNPNGPTITVDVTSYSGETGIPWSPWAFTLLSLGS
jgi:hypothetical protein